MKILIVAGGKEPSESLLKNYAQASDLIIAADKGAESLLKYDIPFNILLGDFDSMDKEALNEKKVKRNWHGEIITYKMEKDFSDTEAAVEKAISYNPEEVILLGAIGTRLDHTLANITLLKKLKENNIHGEIVDEHNRIYIITESTIIKKDSPFISFSAFTKEVTNFSLKGFKYPLNNYTLKFGESLTVSNEIVESRGEVTFDKGYVLVNHTRD